MCHTSGLGLYRSSDELFSELKGSSKNVPGSEERSAERSSGSLQGTRFRGRSVSSEEAWVHVSGVGRCLVGRDPFY